MTTIPSRRRVNRAYRQRNAAKIRAKAAVRRAAKRAGPRICARCGVARALSPRHHYCEGCRMVTEEARKRSGWSTRPTPTRTYDGNHVKQRRRVEKIVEAGNAYCARCGGWIAPGSKWHLDHADDRSTYLGPSHARCNVSAGARKANAVRKTRSRDWL